MFFYINFTLILAFCLKILSRGITDVTKQGGIQASKLTIDRVYHARQHQKPSKITRDQEFSLFILLTASTVGLSSIKEEWEALNGPASGAPCQLPGAATIDTC